MCPLVVDKMKKSIKNSRAETFGKAKMSTLGGISEKQREAIKEAARRELAKREYKYFARYYIKITDKKGQTVPLIQNNIQRQIDAKIDELQAAGIPPKIVILKPRQTGVSTDIQGRMIKETTQKKNRNGFIVSHEDPSTKAIFQKAKYMYDNLPDDLRPLQKASNATELIFDRPTHYQGPDEGLHSKIEIKTAGKAGIGRSETRHYTHLSEFAFWPGSDENSPDKQLTGILNAVPDDIDTWVIVESTAQGHNHFKDFWDDAVAGINGFVPMFFPWYVHEEYVREVDAEIFWQEVAESKQKIRDYISYLYNDLKLPLERVAWWLWTLKIKCHGNINEMKQENPTTPEEAFIFSGSPVFDNEIIQQRIEYLRQKYEKEPPKRGRFYFEWNDPETKDKIKNETIKWVDDPNGPIKIYEDVQTGYPYVIGGDTKGEGSDCFAGTVLNNITGKRCATLHANLDPDTYTHQMYCLGRYFNYALIGIEINFDIYPVKELQRLKYTKQYFREVVDEISKKRQHKYGWKTDGNTRPLIISNEMILIRDNIDLFTDISFLSECLTFVYNKDGRPDAMPGKRDDILFSDMIANQIRTQQRMKIDITQPEPHYNFECEKPKKTGVTVTEDFFKGGWS
jgi:hypothetical protein